jgi:hypothetical protein
LRHALYCDLAAVTGRTLSQSARAAHLSIAARALHFWTAMYVAITVSSTTATCLRLTPLASATWLRSEVFSCACAQSNAFGTSADHFCLQNLQERLRFPQCISRMKSSLRRISHLQIEELTQLSPSLFPQAGAVKPQPMLILPGFSDIGDLRRRSS